MIHYLEPWLTIKNVAKSQKIPTDEQEILDISMTADEQQNMLSLSASLLASKSLEEILDALQYDEEYFTNHLKIDQKIVDNWKVNGFTEFEHDALCFIIFLDEIAFDREHICPRCNDFFYAHWDDNEVCPRCLLEEILPLNDNISESHYFYNEAQKIKEMSSTSPLSNFS